MSRRSIQISLLGSSVRSEVGRVDTPQGRARGRSLPLDQLLAMLPPNDTSFENLSEASGELSVTSHVFEEDDPSFVDTQPQGGGLFSSVHREVMRDLRLDTESGSICSTCSSCDTCSTDTWDALGIDELKIARVTPKPLPPQVEKQMKEQIAQLSIEERVPRERRDRDAESCRMSSRRTGTGAREKLEKERMTGLWNMLATYDEFVVTPPGFNAYQQEKPHWLDQEPIPWEQREKARRKCVRWLNSCQV